jgi:hypothetical protein
VSVECIAVYEVDTLCKDTAGSCMIFLLFLSRQMCDLVTLYSNEISLHIITVLSVLQEMIEPCLIFI